MFAEHYPRFRSSTTQNNNIMKNRNEKSVADKIRVKLDARTIITLNSEAALDYWKSKYPGLKILATAS
jgi:hypothetical protein